MWIPKLQKLFPDLEEADNIYAATLYHADLRIGQLLDALDHMKITENTLVIFSSDNGPARGASDSPITLMYDSATGPGYGIGGAKGLPVADEHLREAFLRGG